MNTEFKNKKKFKRDDDSNSSNPNKTSKVFAGNLSFKIDEQTMRDVFPDINIESIEWLEQDGRFAGRAILTFASSEDAEKAILQNGVSVMDRAIRLELSGANPKNPKKFEKTPRDPNSNTIFIGNLSFQITEDAVKDFFKDCGEISQIRWVEVEGKFKGNGFVEFVSTEAPDEAMKLDGEDLMGRAIRIDFTAARRDRGDRGGRGGDRRGGRGGGDRRGGRGGDRGGRGGDRRGGRGGDRGGRGGDRRGGPRGGVPRAEGTAKKTKFDE